MKILIAIVFLLLGFESGIWTNDLDKARNEAVANNKFILLNFSGSDWCGPCILLKKEVFSTPDFEELASKKLVLMRADFPRMKKNKLSPEDTSKNESLAEIFNPEGKFPFTLLLDEKGRILKTWDGYHGNKEEILAELKAACNE